MIQCKYSLKLFLILPLHLLLVSLSFADDIAEKLFEDNASKVFQVKIIDKISGNKASIGSGFQVSPAGIVATNYHVVSQYILEREKYDIRLMDHEENELEASIINFDIVHDLALLQADGLDEQAFQLDDRDLANGSRIYSMGNPHDLGMTIIEGNYNGLVEGSRYRKYLFSGSLNSGMSGGPTLNGNGEVIGINVSKGGEQISFLVPVKHLKELMSFGYEPLNAEDYSVHTLNYLLRDQEEYYQTLLSIDWITKEFHTFELPDKIHDSLKCWGHTLEKKKKRYDESHRHCRTEDRIYIKSGFYTGGFSFDYEIISSDELNVFQFYSLLEENYQMKRFYNNNDKEDTTNFECETNFILLGSEVEKVNRPWKVSTCIREYIEYKGLYDAGIIALHIGSDNEASVALKIYLMATGVNKANISKLHTKFLSSVRWKE